MYWPSQGGLPKPQPLSDFLLLTISQGGPPWRPRNWPRSSLCNPWPSFLLALGQGACDRTDLTCLPACCCCLIAPPLHDCWHVGSITMTWFLQPLAPVSLCISTLIRFSCQRLDRYSPNPFLSLGPWLNYIPQPLIPGGAMWLILV